MRIIKAASRYETISGSPIQFTETCKDERGNDKVIFQGTTSEELIDIIIDRKRHINQDVYCPYIKEAISLLKEARRNIELGYKHKPKY